MIGVARKVMTAQRDICEAQHHILMAAAGEGPTPIAVAVIRMRLLSAIEHLSSAAQEAERGRVAVERGGVVVEGRLVVDDQAAE